MVYDLRHLLHRSFQLALIRKESEQERESERERVLARALWQIPVLSSHIFYARLYYYFQTIYPIFLVYHNNNKYTVQFTAPIA